MSCAATTFVLVLTLTPIRGGALATVPGYATQGACVASGDAWLSATIPQQNNWGAADFHAICLPISPKCRTDLARLPAHQRASSEKKHD